MVIDDDVAVQDSLYTAGRRGVGATVLAEKICGAAAEDGRSLAGGGRPVPQGERQRPLDGHGADLVHRARRRQPTFELGDDEMEIGIGIHGEPGRERKPMATSAEVVEMMATPIVEDLPFSSGDNVLAFVNGMGGTPLIELYVVYNDLVKLLDRAGYHRQPQPDRPVHHVARDAGLLDHAAQARRRADPAVGCPGEHAGPPLGRVMAGGGEVSHFRRCSPGSRLRRQRIEEQRTTSPGSTRQSVTPTTGST